MRQGRLAADVPARPAVGALGVDHDEALLVGELRIWRAIIVRLGCPGAVVDCDDDGWVRCKLGRDVDVHLGPRSIGTEVGHLCDGLGGALEGGRGRRQFLKAHRRAAGGGGQHADPEEG